MVAILQIVTSLNIVDVDLTQTVKDIDFYSNPIKYLLATQ